MSGKRNQAKHKIDRRLACNLWGRPKSPFNTRQSAPGMHGERRGKPTDYGTQLFAKPVPPAITWHVGITRAGVPRPAV